MSGDLLAGRTAVITGAGSGVGRAAAQVFTREGARVVVSDVRDDWGTETVRLVEEGGGEAVYVHADVSAEDDVDALIAATVERFGRLDVMYNNVGIATPERVTFQDQPV